MIPKHCREVSVKTVSFPITEKNIIKEASGKLAQAATNYMVINNGPDWAIVKLDKANEPGVFTRIVKIKIVSMPAETAFLDNPEVDVQNPSVMVKIAEDAGKDALVVKGKFEHISFVYKEKSTPIVVFDIVPPNPSKIVELVGAALSTGRIRKPIRVIPRILDLHEMAKRRNTKYVMFPCSASCLASGPEDAKNVLYLDQLPALKMRHSEVTLIGCELSMDIFTSAYGEKPPFMNICPKKMAHNVSEAFISRCCLIDAGYEIEGNAAYVPWGASIGEVEEAIINLLGLEIEPAPQDGMTPEAVEFTS